jgi:PPK2 family polyphosphate:nucleotide phosphotransferase
MVDSPYLVRPGHKFSLDDVKTDDRGQFADKHEAAPVVKENLAALDALQEVLYAQAEHAVLIVFQAMDGGGKDGAIDFVFSGLNPQGCHVTSFKVPTHIERAHDFLWRHHIACPAKGMIGIHNRSHYEAVLVERVHEIAPRKVWERRYDHINEFERRLVDEGTTVIKFFLHISKAEQRARLQARVDDPAKHWKFNLGDLDERKKWDEYQDAYADALQRCSTEWAPWYVVPADRKWYRNVVVSDVIVRTLKKLDLKFPKPDRPLEGIVVE